MDKALQKVSHLISEYAVQELQKQFERIKQTPGGDRILKRIATSSDKEQLEDYLAEIRYALVFAGLGFRVEIEPSGSKGPDLKVSRDGHRSIVEITRFRKVHPGPPALDLSDENAVLAEYGNPPRDIRKSFGKILKKFPQVGNEQAIIAIWNDDGDIEDLEVKTAVADLLRDESQRILSLPSGLSFVLYGSNWARAGDQQLYCFPLCHPDQAHQVSWRHELEAATVRGLIQRALT